MANHIPDLEATPLWDDYRYQRGRWLAYQVIPTLIGKLHSCGCRAWLSTDADSIKSLASGWSKVKLLVEIPPGVGWELKLRLNDAREAYFEAKELGGGRRFESVSLEQLIGRMREYQSPSPEASMQSLRTKASARTKVEEVQ